MVEKALMKFMVINNVDAMVCEVKMTNGALSSFVNGNTSHCGRHKNVIFAIKIFISRVVEDVGTMLFHK